MAIEKIYDDSFYHRLFRTRLPFETHLNEDYIDRIYLAGVMDSENSEDSTWRTSLCISDLPGIDVHRPDKLHFDHGGDKVKNCVSSDIAAIDDSDAVVAYFGKTNQVGTFTELMHAMYRDIPVLVILDPDFVDEYQSGAVVERGKCNEFWFLLNYIRGESGWDGAKNADLIVGEPGEIRDSVVLWLERSFNYELLETSPQDSCDHPVGTRIETKEEDGTLELKFICEDCRKPLARKWVEGDAVGEPS